MISGQSQWNGEQIAAAQGLWSLVSELSAGSAAHPLTADLHRRLSEATGDAAGKYTHRASL